MTANQLQRELKKKKPFELLEEAANVNILRTNDQFQNRMGRLFREYGLTSSQYNVLRILRGEAKPMPILEISERMIQVVPAMTGLIDRLELQELVKRDRSTEDRRVIYVEITSKGAEILARLDQPLADLHKSLVGHLSRAELKELSRLLEKCRQSVCPDTE